MRMKPVALVCAALMAAPAPVYANGGDVVGGFIAGMIGAAIINDANNHRTRRHYTSTASSAERAANVEVQTALNFFDYNVGRPDGVFGSRTRSAIDNLQALLGEPITGQLTEYQRTILLSAYHRGMAGGPVVSQIVTTDPQGIRGLLLQQRNEMAGISTQPQLLVQPPAQPAAQSAQPAPGALAAATPPAQGAATALPSFMGTTGGQISLASACNKVSLQTNTNGGFVTVNSMVDPEFALSEQFCLARTYAMSASEDLQAKVQGFTPQQIAEQCAGFAPVLKDSIAALSLRPEAEVLNGVQTFAMNSGMAPAQLAATAKICLGVGYTTDNMDVAVGSALILTALGQHPYAELLGHHLALGFGASQRRDLALAWYDTALQAIAAGETAVAPGLPDRAQVLQKAAFLVTGAGGAPSTGNGTTKASLPTFTAAP